jgi:dTDP-4-dehydrorhamnose 3,5-epimerase
MVGRGFDGRLAAGRHHEGITKDWQLVSQPLIDGVRVQEVKSVPTGYGHLTEIWRKDWGLDEGCAEQAFQSMLQPGEISGWHAHAKTTDRLFVSRGQMRIVLYDSRLDSPTHGRVSEFRFGEVRHALVVVPPRVYHGVQCMGSTPALLINVVDRAYDYVDPDHYRLPLESPEIPYRFDTSL